VVAPLAVLMTGRDRGAAPTTNTPVDQLPWRVVEAPSGGLRVDLPAEPVAGAISSAAGTGQQLKAKVTGFDVTIAEFSVSRGPNEARSLVGPLISERADLLNGHADTVDAVSSRVGQAFEGMVVAGAPVGVVRVVLDGSTLYVIEIRGDVQSVRAQQIFERVVQSFTPTRTR